MKQTKLNLLKQIVLCAWMALTIYVWLILNLGGARYWKLVPIISQSNIKARELVWPFIYRPYIYAEKKSNERK